MKKLIIKNIKKLKRTKRHKRIRKKVIGTSEKPRLSIYRSLKGLHVQFVDDISHKTIVGMSTCRKDIKKLLKNSANVEAAKKFAELVAVEISKKGIERIVFDRGGYCYHGRIKAFADSLREKGIKF